MNTVVIHLDGGPYDGQTLMVEESKVVEHLLMPLPIVWSDEGNFKVSGALLPRRCARYHQEGLVHYSFVDVELREPLKS
jgi:hypothetical protein